MTEINYLSLGLGDWWWLLGGGGDWAEGSAFAGLEAAAWFSLRISLITCRMTSGTEGALSSHLITSSQISSNILSERLWRRRVWLNWCWLLLALGKGLAVFCGGLVLLLLSEMYVWAFLSANINTNEEYVWKK